MKRVLLSLVLVGACASGMNQSPARQRNQIELEEITATTVEVVNAYDVVQRLRPLWLRKRAAPHHYDESQTSTILVFVDNARFGEVERLRDIPKDAVQSMRLLDPTETTALVGLDAVDVDHIIMVVMRRR